MEFITNNNEKRLKNFFDENKFIEYFKHNMRLSMGNHSVLIIITKSDLFYEINDLSFKDKYLKSDVKTLIDSMLIKEMCYKGIIELAVGASHMFARTFDNKIYGWGSNYFGQLGNGKMDEDMKVFNRHELSEFLSELNIETIECGAFHSLALTRNGEVYAWGSNTVGQVGKCLKTMQLSPIKVISLEQERVVRISCGGQHSLALSESGRVYGWGWNEFGQLGFENSLLIHIPKIIELSDVKICKIGCGAYHTLLLSESGVIYTFGKNEHEQIGNGTTENQSKPMKLFHEKKFINIASYWRSNVSIGLSSDNVHYVWGEFNDEKILRPKQTGF
jgi:alpha-tubulin suppressor-like RCC1 family protein